MSTGHCFSNIPRYLVKQAVNALPEYDAAQEPVKKLVAEANCLLKSEELWSLVRIANLVSLLSEYAYTHRPEAGLLQTHPGADLLFDNTPDDKPISSIACLAAALTRFSLTLNEHESQRLEFADDSSL